MIRPKLDMWIKTIGINIKIETLQKSKLLGTARSFGNVEFRLDFKEREQLMRRTLGPEVTGCNQI